MLKSPTFWDDEQRAPLMKLCGDFLSVGHIPPSDIFNRAESWISLVGAEPNQDEFRKLMEGSHVHDRIFQADAERTYASTENRAKHVRFLSALRTSFGDYAQGLGFFASFLNLFLKDYESMAILQKLNSDPKYIPGYWKAEALAFAVDAYVFQHLLQIRNPKLAAHLESKLIFPETFCQKWFVGLGVHVLPFSDMFTFLDDFFRFGFKYLLAVGLAVTHVLQRHLMECQQVHEIYELLRLEPAIIKRHHLEEASAAIVRHAHEFICGPNDDHSLISSTDFPALRTTVYETKLKSRMEAAKKAHAKKEENVSEDEEDSSDLSEGTACGICDEMVPDVFCTLCKLPVCEDCHQASSKPHQKSHKTVPFDDENPEHVADLAARMAKLKT